MRFFIIVAAVLMLIACGENTVSGGKGTGDEYAYPECDKNSFSCTPAEYNSYMSASQKFAKCAPDCKDEACRCVCYNFYFDVLTESVYIQCGACGLYYSAITQNDPTLDQFKDKQTCIDEMTRIWGMLNTNHQNCPPQN